MDMEERHPLPNPNLNAAQHFKVLATTAQALDYILGGGVGYRPVYKILNAEDKTIRSNQIWPTLEFFEAARLVQLENYQARATQSMIEWAIATRDGDESHAKDVMQKALRPTWFGQAAVHAAQAGQRDAASLAQAIKAAGGYAANDDDKTNKSVRVLVEFVEAFGLLEGVSVVSFAPPPEPEPPPVVPPVTLPVVPDTIEEVAQPQEETPAVTAPQPRSMLRRISTASVAQYDSNQTVRVEIKVSLPEDADEATGRRLGRALRALLEEAGVGPK
jgi:hypothetical protein